MLASILCHDEIDKNFQSLRCFHKLDYMEKELVMERMTKKHLVNFREVAGLDWVTLSELMAVTDRTLHSMKHNQRFKGILLDRFMALLYAYSVIYSHIGNRMKANSWLRARAWRLKSQKPIELMKTWVGMHYLVSCIEEGRITVY